MSSTIDVRSGPVARHDTVSHSPERSVFGARRLTFALLWLFVLTLPWLAVVSFAAVGSLSRLAGLAVALSAAAVFLTSGWRRRLLDTHFLAMAFTGWVVLSYLWSIERQLTFTAAFTMLQLLFTVLVIWEFADTRERQIKLFTAYVLGAIVSCIGVANEFLGGEEVAVRYTIEGAHPNGLAFTLALGVPMAWFLGQQAKTLLARLVFWSYIPLSFMGILLSASRSTLLVVAVALLIIPGTFRHLSRARRLLLFGSCVAAVALALALVPDSTMERIANLDEEVTSGDFSGRAQLWESSLILFDERPLVGVGAGASRDGIEELTGTRQGAHNSFISVGSELGVVGLTLFVLVLLTVGLRLLRVQGPDRKFLLILYFTLLIGLLPRHWEYDKATWVTLSLVLGMALSSAATHLRARIDAARDDRNLVQILEPAGGPAGRPAPPAAG